MANALAFIKLSRLPFLLGGALMYALGASVADAASWRTYVLGQLLVSSAQLTAHYVNEYADYASDLAIVNRTSFSGGSGVLTTGALSPRVALQAGFATTAVCLTTVLVVARHSPSAALLGLLALVVSWTYSMPPLRLVATGFGELATALTVVGIVPAIGAFLHGGVDGSRLAWIIVTLVPAQLAMLLAFELPDLEADARTGKRVLGVRLGRSKTQLLIAALFLLTAVLVGSSGLPALARASAITAIPFAVVAIAAAARDHYKALAVSAVAAFTVCGAAMLIGLVAT